MKKQLYFFVDKLKELLRLNKYTHRRLVGLSIGYRNDILLAGIRFNQEDDSNIFNLRRNIHRIEKGLSYAKVKNVFALDYILDTVSLLSKLENDERLDTTSFDWSVSVLRRYFDSVDSSNPVVSHARNIFLKINIDKTKEYSFYPYKFKDRTENPIQYEDLLGFSLQRRSVRFFKPKKVVREDLLKAFNIARLSPSACNRQSFRFLFFDDEEFVGKLSAIPGGVAGYKLYNIIVVVGDYSGYFSERDINAPVIDASLASMSFLYGCETVGLSTVCINWPNIKSKEKQIRRLIDLKKSEFVVMLIGLGYPEKNGKIPYSGKRCNDFLLINERKL